MITVWGPKHVVVNIFVSNENLKKFYPLVLVQMQPVQSDIIDPSQFSSRHLSLPDLRSTERASYQRWRLAVLTAAHMFAVILWLILKPLYIIFVRDFRNSIDILCNLLLGILRYIISVNALIRTDNHMHQPLNIKRFTFYPRRELIFLNN
jgi:hypothetical protein